MLFRSRWICLTRSRATTISTKLVKSYIRSRGFKLAITSEIIGKLGGGAGVEEAPVSGEVSGSSSASTLMTTITVPEGKTWLVSVIGTATAASPSFGRYPEIAIGTTRAAFNGMGGASALVTGTVEIRLHRNYTLKSDSFTGTVYTVEM